MEGVLFDRIGLTNFVDVDSARPVVRLTKGLTVNVLSEMLDMDLPTRMNLGGTSGRRSFPEIPHQVQSR